MQIPKKPIFVACPVCGRRVEGKEVGQHISHDHADVAWRQYAQTYLAKMWFGQNQQDKRLVDSFKNPVTCDMLHDLFLKYGVNRTVPGNGAARLKPFAAILNSYRNIAMTVDNVPGIIEQEVGNMRAVYGKGPLSAITKSLWMMKQHPIVIYDYNTWRGLSGRRLAPGYKRYGTYFESWFKFFADPETQKGLDDALSWLPESPAARTIVEEAQSGAANTAQAIRDEIRTLSASQLMRNRVTDMRLFYEGGGYLEDSISD